MHIPTTLPSFKVDGAPASHRTALRRAVKRWQADPATRAVLLIGSLARGDSLPSSDIDLSVIVSGKGISDGTHAYDGEILVETNIQSLDMVRPRLIAKPNQLYRYVEAKVLYDTGIKAELAQTASEVWNSYRISPEEMQASYIWLRKIQGKLEANLARGKMVDVGYLVANTAGEILSDLFIRAGWPPPSNGGTALAFMQELEDYPIIQRMYDGDITDRAKAAIELIGKVLAYFDGLGFDKAKMV